LSEKGTIVQTNIDHCSSDPRENILYSIQRRDIARRLLNQMPTINEEELWKVKHIVHLLLIISLIQILLSI